MLLLQLLWYIRISHVVCTGDVCVICDILDAVCPTISIPRYRRDAWLAIDIVMSAYQYNSYLPHCFKWSIDDAVLLKILHIFDLLVIFVTSVERFNYILYDTFVYVTV